MSRGQAIELFLIELPLVRPFRVSFGTSTGKQCVLARVRADGVDGWGECVADDGFPGFSGEWNEGAWTLLHDGARCRRSWRPATSRAARSRTGSASVRGNPMAKATLIDAVLDAELRARIGPLAAWLGGASARVACGVSIGIAGYHRRAARAGRRATSSQGYRRIKLKIEPGTRRRARCARSARRIPTSCCRSTRTPRTRWRTCDVFRCARRARPADDRTAAGSRGPRPITRRCRRGSERRSAWTSPSGRPPTRARRWSWGMPDHQHQAGPGRRAPRGPARPRRRAGEQACRCGAAGCSRPGSGRAPNLALAALPGFTLPGDTSASGRYFAEDLTEPFVLEPDGTMAVPTGPGIGVEPRRNGSGRALAAASSSRAG